MGAYSPVIIRVVLVRIVLLVVSKEVIELDRLLEVFDGFEASDVLEEVKITEDVNTSSDQSVPVNGLQLDVGVVLLELEIDGLSEVDVRSLDGMHVLTSHFKLVEIEVFREDLHFYQISNINYNLF